MCVEQKTIFIYGLTVENVLSFVTSACMTAVFVLTELNHSERALVVKVQTGRFFFPCSHCKDFSFLFHSLGLLIKILFAVVGGGGMDRADKTTTTCMRK